MPDREKVIKGLECCCASKANRCESNSCPYWKSEICCIDEMLSDALALLKEQETELICNLLGGQPYEVYCRECRTVLCILSGGTTMNDVKSVFSYCPHCGRSVK